MGKIAVLEIMIIWMMGNILWMKCMKNANFTLLTMNLYLALMRKTSMNIVGIDSAKQKCPLPLRANLSRMADSLDPWTWLCLSSRQHSWLWSRSIRSQPWRPDSCALLSCENERRPSKYTDGLYLLAANTLLSVSNGVGTTAIPARFAVPPEITYYHLVPAEKHAHQNKLLSDPPIFVWIVRILKSLFSLWRNPL